MGLVLRSAITGLGSAKACFCKSNSCSKSQKQAFALRLLISRPVAEVITTPKEMILLDTDSIMAFFDSSDNYNALCMELLKEMEGREGKKGLWHGKQERKS